MIKRRSEQRHVTGVPCGCFLGNGGRLVFEVSTYPRYLELDVFCAVEVCVGTGGHLYLNAATVSQSQRRGT